MISVNTVSYTKQNYYTYYHTNSNGECSSTSTIILRYGVVGECVIGSRNVEHRCLVLWKQCSNCGCSIDIRLVSRRKAVAGSQKAEKQTYDNK